MNKAVILTGTPGTGKTTIAQQLEKEGYPIVYVTEFVKNNKYYEYYDEKRDSYVIDEDVLFNALNKVVEENSREKPVVIEGHVAEVDNEKLLLCIVLRCSIKNLRERLSKRAYSASKIDENVEAEIMEVILTDMFYLYGESKVKVVNTDGKIEETYLKVKTLIESAIEGIKS